MLAHSVLSFALQSKKSAGDEVVPNKHTQPCKNFKIQ